MTVKYRGKYPDRINSVSSDRQGITLAVTNSGALYMSNARKLRGIMPRLDVELDLLFWSYLGQSRLRSI